MRFSPPTIANQSSNVGSVIVAPLRSVGDAEVYEIHYIDGQMMERGVLDREGWSYNRAAHFVVTKRWHLGASSDTSFSSLFNCHDCPVGDEDLEDWYTDPFGRHEARWMSHGIPTGRVRDGRTEDTDPVLDEPFTTKPMRVKYVERQVGAESDGFLKSKGGIAVPGGIVTIEPHLSRDGQVPRAKVLLQATTAMGAANVKRDIVVWDEAHAQQLYRDGPYDSITVDRPLERIANS